MYSKLCPIPSYDIRAAFDFVLLNQMTHVYNIILNIIKMLKNHYEKMNSRIAKSNRTIGTFIYPIKWNFFHENNNDD